MHYSIRHVTKYRYSSPISESMTEVRMHPISGLNQRCHSFQLSVEPKARTMSYLDHLSNIVHHFDIPRHHTQLKITAQSVVEVNPAPILPAALEPAAWEQLDAIVAIGDYYEMLLPSQFTQPTPLLYEFAKELRVERRDDPLTLLRQISQGIYERFEYKPNSTRVDSLIDEALKTRSGVCQDFAHIMITLARMARIPCRYVSGYLYYNPGDTRSSADSSHAWVEALIPGCGWVEFDPTNELVADSRHIRAAVGCDYADVPPTRGVFKGKARSELEVSVSVQPASEPAHHMVEYATNIWQSSEPEEQEELPTDLLAQQFQQQQQQQ